MASQFQSRPTAIPTPSRVHLFIDGEKQRSTDGETYENYGATGRLVNIVESASWSDIERAIETASTVQSAWESRPVSDRRDILLKAAEIVVDPSKKYIQALSDTLTSTLGEKYNWSSEVYGGAYLLKGYASLSGRLTGEAFPSRLPGGVVVTQRRAYGVVLVISPWNCPFTLAIRVISTALLCGNTVVFRSSELAPRAHEILVELLNEAGLPKGVLNLIHISKEHNPVLVPKIIAHDNINLISFTGSSAVGSILAAEAGKHLKQIVLELGGKAAAIVLEDADIVEAAKAIVLGVYNISGQMCMATSRVIVQRSVADALIKELVSLTRKLKTGAGEGANLPGVRTVAFAERVVTFIKEAKDKGAEVLVGDMTNDGSTVQPHLLLGYHPDMKAWNDEIFGPVLGIMVCDTVDEAIELTNKTKYSLTNTLWTENLKALEWASRIRSGMVFINGNSVHVEFGIGLTGLGGNSGYGAGDIESFTQTRAIVVFNEKIHNPLLDSLGL